MFHKLAFMNWPKAVLDPPKRFSTPFRPVVSAVDPAANGFHPPGNTLPSADAGDEEDAGDARFCSTVGSTDISCVTLIAASRRSAPRPGSPPPIEPPARSSSCSVAAQ